MIVSAVRPGALPPAAAPKAAALVRAACAALALSACAAEPDPGGSGAGLPLVGGRGESAEAAEGFARAAGTREWRFPRDHGAHPEYATEWWYTTGIVRTDEGRRFGYELTFFRRGLLPPGEAADRISNVAAAAATDTSPWRARGLILAHATITDVARGRFVAEERLARAAQGWAGADTASLDVWIDEWRMRDTGEELRLRVTPESTGGELGLDLSLSTGRPPVLHGAGGLSPKDSGPDPQASWYVSLPRLDTAGTLTVGGETHRVAGTTWMDHEFFSGGLAPEQVGWDWFSARLADGRDLMLFRVRDARGQTDYVAGTMTTTDGTSWRALETRGAAFQPLDLWRSRGTGADYPVAWRVRLPAEDLELTTRTPVAGQEVAASRAGGFTYWEGLVDVSGRWAGESVRGEGYVEMTGYDAPLELR